MRRMVAIDIVGQARGDGGAVERAAGACMSEHIELLQRPCFVRAAAVAAPAGCGAAHAISPAGAGVPARVRGQGVEI